MNNYWIDDWYCNTLESHKQYLMQVNHLIKRVEDATQRNNNNIKINSATCNQSHNTWISKSPEHKLGLIIHNKHGVDIIQK